MRRSRSVPDFSDLPSDLLVEIGKKLEKRIEILRFRSICRSFRASIPLPSKTFSPYKSFNMPTPGTCMFLLAESTVYAIEPPTSTDTTTTTKAWLVQVEESKSGEVQLMNPLVGCEVSVWLNRFPLSFSNIELFNNINLLDYHVREITKGYKLGFYKDQGDNEVERLGWYGDKVVVSASFDEIDDEFAVMRISTLPGAGKVLLWTIGDKEWTHVGIDHRGGSVKDIVHHNKKFYALYSSGLTIAVDPKSLIITTVAPARPPRNPRRERLQQLLKSLDDLLRIEVTFGKDSDKLKVYKLDEKKCEWVRVRNKLKDRMLFLGPDCSFSVSPQEFSECRKNCVYFTQYIFDKEKKKSVMHSPFLDDYYKFLSAPPTWLRQSSSSAP